MNWSIAITDSNADTFGGDLEAAFDAAYSDAPAAVRAQFVALADGAEELVIGGHVGDAPFQATLQGYVTEDGEPSTSNSVGFSVIGTVTGE